MLYISISHQTLSTHLGVAVWVENRTGNRLTEPVFKTARKPDTNHKPTRTEPNRNRTVPRFAGAASVKATNPHYWPLLVLIFASAVLATHETPLKLGKQKNGPRAISDLVFFWLLGFGADSIANSTATGSRSKAAARRIEPSNFACPSTVGTCPSTNLSHQLPLLP